MHVVRLTRYFECSSSPCRLTHHMKRLAVEDAADRAQKCRGLQLMRVHLDQIGFWPNNRGGLGIAPFHCHEIAWGILSDKTKLQRYGQVDVVEIPEHLLKKFHEINRAKCEADVLMPSYSKNIKYVCASKTHFVHAQKLCQDGASGSKRNLFNQGQVPIEWRADDGEGRAIITDGPLCAIFTSDLMEDTAAMEALASDDNLNASVQMQECEMQAFGRAHEMVGRLHPDRDAKEDTISKMIEQMKMSGLGHFTTDDWGDFLALRFSLPKPHAQVLQSCMFNACAGRVRVDPSDYGKTAKLDPQAPWTKVAVLLFQYIGTPMRPQAPCVSSASSFNGTVTVNASKINKPTCCERACDRERLRV